MKGEAVRVMLLDRSANENLVARVARLSRGVNPCNVPVALGADHPQNIADAKLIRALFRMKHLTPFEFISATFYIECPIFVARQLMRYRCASYVERSLRYCEPIDGELTDEYKAARKQGALKEDARACLPLSTTTALCMRVNLRSLFHIFDERLRKPGAQEETKQLVDEMKRLAEGAFPICMKVWAEED